MMKLPRVLITATQSGTGKTMISCAVLAALKNRNISIAPFKCGPDYIDTMFHKKIFGIESRNLDCFLMTESGVKKSLSKNGRGNDLSIIEGVMGYYDGLGLSTNSSSYHLSQVTKTPAVLIVNCKGLSLSAAAIIKGFLEYRSDSNIVGIILNRVSKSMYERLGKQLEKELPVKLLGYFPENKAFQMESRHLGLLAPDEIQNFHRLVNLLAEQAEKSIDLDGIMALASTAEDMPDYTPPLLQKTNTINIAIANDEAFSFYYQDNLDSLYEMGCNLTFFSPIHDKTLPKGTQGLILGGGYPEIYAEALSQNKEMLQSIKEAICEKQIPTIAECGGFLYLHDSLEDINGNIFTMAGVIEGHGFATHKLCRFGYHELISTHNGLLPNNITIPAHEFHYWDSSNIGNSFLATKPLTDTIWDCGHGSATLFAGFSHVHFYGANKFLENFVATCKATYKEEA